MSKSNKTQSEPTAAPAVNNLKGKFVDVFYKMAGEERYLTASGEFITKYKSKDGTREFIQVKTVTKSGWFIRSIDVDTVEHIQEQRQLGSK